MYSILFGLRCATLNIGWVSANLDLYLTKTKAGNILFVGRLFNNYIYLSPCFQMVAPLFRRNCLGANTCQYTSSKNQVDESRVSINFQLKLIRWCSSVSEAWFSHARFKARQTMPMLTQARWSARLEIIWKIPLKMKFVSRPNGSPKTVEYRNCGWLQWVISLFVTVAKAARWLHMFLGNTIASVDPSSRSRVIL